VKLKQGISWGTSTETPLIRTSENKYEKVCIILHNGGEDIQGSFKDDMDKIDGKYGICNKFVENPDVQDMFFSEFGRGFFSFGFAGGGWGFGGGDSEGGGGSSEGGCDDVCTNGETVEIENY